MAYTAVLNETRLTYVDIGDDEKGRDIRMALGETFGDADAGRFGNVSKCVVRSYEQGVKMIDNALQPIAESESVDACRLYFKKEDGSEYHLDITDPVNSLFLGTTGSGQNIVKEYVDLAAASAGTPENDLSLIIDDVVSGRILIGNSSPVTAYLRGERL